MELATGTVVDRYTVQSVLGEGGMAVVYLCRHNQLGTMHALKVLSMTSRAIRERLVQEGRVQAQLRHRNIVAVTDIITLNGAPGLVMEYIEGPSLDELLDQKALSYDQVDVLAEGILDGVSHAHAQGLIHRDLKPANIMLALEGSMLVPKITDFGLAKLLEAEPGRAATRTGSTMGTPHYMSPEQVSDSKNVDHRTDVFALGAILYELVTGRRAFGGENLLQIFSAVASAEFTPPRQLKPDLPERMERAILGALEPDRDKRIQSVEQLRAVWTGKAQHLGGAQPKEPAGPFSADFISSVSKGSSPPREDTMAAGGTWAGESRISVADAPISVESLVQGPPLDPTVAPVPPEPRNDGVPADSLVSGTSVILGSGLAFGLIALIGGGGLVVVIGLVAFFTMGGGDEGPRRADRRAARNAPISAPADPAPGRARPAPETPKPDRTRRDRRRNDPAPVAAPAPGPAPAPDAVVDAVAPEPSDVVEPDADPDAVDPDALDPDAVDPDAVDPDAPDEPDADPEGAEPETPEPASLSATGNAGLASIDARLVHEDPSLREKGVTAIASRPGVSAALVSIARNDTSTDVRIRAWQVVVERYVAQNQEPAVEEALVVEALRTGIFSKREAAIAYGRAGTDYNLLVPLVQDSGGALELKAAANAMVKIAERTGKNAEVKQILETEAERASFINKKVLLSAASSL